MLLDNNVFGYKGYKKIFEQIRKINKPNLFKDDMDGRIYTVTAVATHKDGRKTTSTAKVTVPH